jgi:hypothetical protein
MYALKGIKDCCTSAVSLLAPMGPSPEETIVIFLVEERGVLISPATRGSTCTRLHNRERHCANGRKRGDDTTAHILAEMIVNIKFDVY